jgi:hypothetical protein
MTNPGAAKSRFWRDGELSRITESLAGWAIPNSAIEIDYGHQTG